MKKKFIYIHSLKNEVIAFDEIMEENRSLTAHCKMIFIVALKYKVYIAINIPAEIFIYNFFLRYCHLYFQVGSTLLTNVLFRNNGDLSLYSDVTIFQRSKLCSKSDEWSLKNLKSGGKCLAASIPYNEFWLGLGCSSSCIPQHDAWIQSPPWHRGPWEAAAMAQAFGFQLWAWDSCIEDLVSVLPEMIVENQKWFWDSLNWQPVRQFTD